MGDRGREKEEARDRDPIAHLSQLQIADRAMLQLSEGEGRWTEVRKKEKAKWKALQKW